ncbi:DUF58 domain-containing protein [Paenibacillus ferrarius]|uniref:DUF58 domain-containing protein n=1 Tax=Paenibacillus ferrarius TaxID=1469647 RepID=UPI003D2A1934
MKRPVLLRFGERPRLPAALWFLITLVTITLFFLLFQGGKLASMLFIIMLLLSVYLLSGYWSGIRRSQGTRKLTVQGAEAKVEAGSMLDIRISVQIPGVWPIPYVLLKDRLIRANGDESVFEGSIVPDWKRRGEFHYVTPPLRRGYYRFDATDCLTEDIFGFFQHKGRLELQEPITVYPQTVAIREWAQFHHMLKGMQHHSTSTRSHRETTQINGVREYIYGDRLSRIHWNATAKTGTWKSKEFERESLPKTIVVLDRTARSYRDAMQFELAVSIAASIFRFGTGRELALGLLSPGKTFTYYEPKMSQHQHSEIVNHLVGVEADGFQSLSQMIKERSREWPQGCFFVLISPVKGGPMLQILKQLELMGVNPCHIWVGGGGTQPLKSPAGPAVPAHEDWVKAVRALGYMAYEVNQLADLPEQLGGVKRYA